MADTILQKTAVPFDGSDVAEEALASLVPIVGAVDGELHFITVLDDFVKHELEGFATTEGATIQEVAKASLARIESHARSMGVRASSQLASGEAAPGILSAAQLAECTALAVPTHDFSGVTRLFMGDVAGKLARDAGMPVLLIPPRKG